MCNIFLISDEGTKKIISHLIDVNVYLFTLRKSEMIFVVCMAFHLDNTVDNVHCRRIQQFIKKKQGVPEKKLTFLDTLYRLIYICLPVSN